MLGLHKNIDACIHGISKASNYPYYYVYFTDNASTYNFSAMVHVIISNGLFVIPKKGVLEYDHLVSFWTRMSQMRRTEL